ncbi:MAG: flagellar protein FlaG [Pseudomonadales bacterium]|nr:flagellar protein FlaG [Pseudomonadales bacterium]
MTSLSRSGMSSGSSTRKVTQSGSSGGSQGRHDLATGGNSLPERRAGEVVSHAATQSSLSQAVKNASSFAKHSGRRLKFSIEERLNRSIVTVRDEETDEIVRQIPMEEMLALAKLLAEVQGPGEDTVLKGLFFDQDT